MKQAIRITAVPRAEHPNSGLQAMSFAEHFGDIVWALPAPGEYVGRYANVRFFPLDTPALKKLLPLRVIRAAFFLYLFLAVAKRDSRKTYFVHSFVFAVPLYLMRRSYCLFFHGSDHRFLRPRWGQKVAGAAIGSFGVGFGLKTDLVTVSEVPNVFVPAPARLNSEIEYDFLFVLRNAPVKNPYYPLRLVEELQHRLPLRVAVLGVSEAELPPVERDRLRALRRGGAQISYMGRRTYEEVVRMMQASRIIMVPSHSEGIPKVILEGMAQGMHVAVNERLSFPKSIESRIAKLRLDDWESVAAFAKARRASGRSIENIAFAHDYLEASRKELAARYTDLYSAESRSS